MAFVNEVKSSTITTFANKMKNRTTEPLVNITNSNEITPLNNKTKTNKVRWKLSEAPQQLLQLFNDTNAVSVGDNMLSNNGGSNSPSTVNFSYEYSTNFDGTTEPQLRSSNVKKSKRYSFRKQLYPRRSPDSSSDDDDYVFRVNIYEIYRKNPNLLLKTLKESKEVEQKPKENPFVLGLNELIYKIILLNINHTSLNFTKCRITWHHGSKPLYIKDLEGYNLLHDEERKVCSTLRMPPLQYLRGKLAILNGAEEFQSKNKIFKKVDAQHLVNFDVNKASKLWQFFDSLGWI
ncbi:20391_t:CDS:2 [Funneliformis geosporum]|uniref:1867_t:CDS:1 n=1 Tax=Funneliformis geosporum TaxID=1117311 RepID=A0A9W4SG81_9GLOM|nr:20391_t:CDS:2 [Funneliformis geosporum]CAI2167268.1 1867_t:CDS:2 [Funneliformis geosporum]